MYLGVDIGSSSSKAIVMNSEGTICGRAVINIGTGSSGPEKVVKMALDEAGITREEVHKCVCTGYGRLMYEGADKQISEISCHAKGVTYYEQGIRTIIDIGGQDAKVIRLSESGRVENFVMNEKCAAGTGRFMEVIARVLDCSLEELSDIAAAGSDGVTISSVCTVFAESEMISQLSEGRKREDVALGALKSIAQKTAGLVKRVGLKETAAITGGVALNGSLVKAVSEEIGVPVVCIRDPQLTGAVGAAVYAGELDKNDKEK